MSQLLSFREAHFFGLPSQSNVYGMTNLSTASNSILVASLRNPAIYTIEFHKTTERILPSTKEIHFTYIPSGAEIISIGAFNKSDLGNDFVIGITFIKVAIPDRMAIDNQTSAQYLNIYFDWESGPDFNLDSIAQSCTSVSLVFIPYQLYNTKIFNGDVQETVWLLSGSDAQIHLYRENKSMHKFVEESVKEQFPEFDKLPSIVMWMNIVNIEANEKRLTAIGCEDGYLGVFYVNTETKTIEANWDICHDGPITYLQFFTTSSTIKVPVCLESVSKLTDSNDPSFHLLVTNSLEPSVVYRNVLKDGLENQLILPDSDHYDCVLCACVADVDMDGRNEIVLGTYGQEILIYKYNGDNINSESDSEEFCLEPEYYLKWQKSFAYPLHSIKYIDITNDGMNELIVLSLKGMHILQHPSEEVAKVCAGRLAQLIEKLKGERKCIES
uniref:Kaptin n=1 Tax=Strigamia maritima TaxID=126957 RepID=T1J5Z3_STRMM